MSKTSIKPFFITHKKQIVTGFLIVAAFFAGLIIPSPFFKSYSVLDDLGNDMIAVKDTTNMVLPDGAVYEGSLNTKTNAFHGYGVLVKGNSSYEGNWKNGKLPYGKRTTPQSVYEGRFNDDLDNNGFGIIKYTPEYIEGKRKQGLSDNEITVTYIGNWKKNLKHGVGRAILADSSMDFGKYHDGLLNKIERSNYHVGDYIYGIDVSRHQGDINWDKLALYCTNDGRVFRFKPKDENDRKYMQPVFFAYMKATEGATVKDKTFDIRMIEAERHGIVKGAYHFLRLGSPVEEQIKNFTETANWTPGDLPPALDVEVESEITTHGVSKLLDMTYRWLEAVEAKFGVRPIIYTRENIRDKYLAKDSRFNKYQCWIARYHPDGPENEEWRVWQMTENGHVNGYDGPIDIDLFKGDYKSFSNYLKSIASKEISASK